MTARDELAAAASSVEGVSVTPYFRQSTQPLAGFVTKASTARDDSGFGWMDTWNIVLPLGQDYESAETVWESIGHELLTALDAVIYVTGVTFNDLQYDAASMPGAVITGTREG